MKILSIILFIVLFLMKCEEPKLKLEGTSWYLWSSTDSTVNRNNVYKQKRFLGFSYFIAIHSFGPEHKLTESYFNADTYYGHINMPAIEKTWTLKTDTLTMGEEEYLVKSISRDSLKLEKLQNVVGRPVINTYYRIER